MFTFIVSHLLACIVGSLAVYTYLYSWHIYLFQSVLLLLDLVAFLQMVH